MNSYKILLNLILFFIGNFIVAQSDQAFESNSLENKNILVIWGGWEGHQPEVYARKVSKWARSKGANVIISDSLGVYSNKEIMGKMDLILQHWTMGSITEEQSRGLIEAVKSGTGLVGCHGGIGDSFRNNPEYQYMVGGQWVAHPGGKINYKVEIENTDDPIIQGIDDFEIFNTEKYYMHVDPNVKVLARTIFSGDHDEWIEGATMPVVWKKIHKKGRVYYMSIGHNPEDFDHPAVWTLLTRGIYWAANGKIQSK